MHTCTSFVPGFLSTRCLCSPTVSFRVNILSIFVPHLHFLLILISWLFFSSPLRLPSIVPGSASRQLLFVLSLIRLSCVIVFYVGVRSSSQVEVVWRLFRPTRFSGSVCQGAQPLHVSQMCAFFPCTASINVLPSVDAVAQCWTQIFYFCTFCVL